MVTTKDNGGELIFTVTDTAESPCGNTVRINEDAQAVINEIRAETGLSAAAIASRLIIFAGAVKTVNVTADSCIAIMKDIAKALL